MENKLNLKTKTELALLKMMMIDPVIDSNLFISDTHHFYVDVETQVMIMLGVSLDSIHEDDLARIDNMFLSEEDIYRRIKRRYLWRIKLFNKLLEDISKSGVSIKKIDFGYGNPFYDTYESRTSIFKVICNQHPEIAFKTKKHFDEENDPMFKGSFLVGINTPLGIVTYHFKLEHFDEFKIPEVERGPKYDNYTIQDCLYRLASLVDEKLVSNHLRIRSSIQGKN